MVKLKEQHPVEIFGQIRQDLIKHWAEDKEGKKYYIRQVETGVEYGEAIDLYPCRYTYEVTDKEITEEVPQKTAI